MSAKKLRNATREKRSQSCFELQGKQYLHASLSTLSLPPTLVPRLQPRPPHLLPPPSPQADIPRTCSVHGLYKPTKSSRLRARSAPVSYPEPDYRHMARRRRQSALEAKTITAEKILEVTVPEGETLHSFLIGGRYNSAHQMDSRSLQRLGVYVPRNSSAKAFINPAGTIPPSSAVYGMYPLKKHLPLVVPRHNSSASQSATDHGLFLIKQDLDRQLAKGAAAASTSSLFSQPSSLSADFNSVESGGKYYSSGDEESKTVTMNGEGKFKEGKQVINREHYSTLVEHKNAEETVVAEHSEALCMRKDMGSGIGVTGDVHAGDRRRGSNDSGSSVVSDSNLLSPEAQLLTQKILLESEHVSGIKNTSTELYRCDSTKMSIKNQGVNHYVSKNKPSDALSICKKTAENLYETKASTDVLKTATTEQQVKDDERQVMKKFNLPEEMVPLTTASSARPHSATCLKRKNVSNTVSNRPKSAMQISSKQASNSEKGSTIFVDLSNVHPLHSDSAAS